MLLFRLKGRWTPYQHCQSTEWSLHCSMLSFRLKGRWTPAGQHCQSTEWSLHCSMLSFRLTSRWTPSVQNTARAQSDLFTVQCCHSDSKADGPPQSTLSEHRVISSLFNVVIQTQRQMDPPINTVRAQSDLFTVQCCHSDSKADGPPQNTVRAQSDLFTVQCCHWDSKADGPPPGQDCQSTEWSLHCSMLSFRLKGRWTPYVQNTARAQSDLFTVQCCHSDSKADGPLLQHYQSTEWSLHCSMLSLRLTHIWTAYVQTTVRAQSDLFTVQCCHWDSKADGPPLCKTLPEHRVISSLFNVVIRLKGRRSPQSTLLEHRVISSLFNVAIETERQVDPQNTVRA